MSGTSDLNRAYREARQTTRRYATTFYFASHVLPPRKRAGAYAVYAFCREADNAVDAAPLEADPGARLDEIRTRLDDLYAGRGCGDGSWPALADTVRRTGIPRVYFDDVLRGIEMDLAITRYEDFPSLKEYCYCVASVVGLMMTRVLGLSDDRALGHAEDLGTGMQLTNIIRDVGEDGRLGRVYLPQEDLRRFNVPAADLERERVTPGFVELIKFQIARAREYYALAEPGIAMLPNDGSRLCVRLMSSIYGGILDAVEANEYDVYRHRAHVPLLEKVKIAVGARRPAWAIQRRAVDDRSYQHGSFPL